MLRNTALPQAAQSSAMIDFAECKAVLTLGQRKIIIPKKSFFNRSH
jgi:hypothetical protein